MYRSGLASHGTGKKRVEENANVSLFETDIRALLYSALITLENLRRSTSRTLLVKLEWIEFGCVTAFINVTG